MQHRWFVWLIASVLLAPMCLYAQNGTLEISQSVVRIGAVRIEVLTPELLRLEFSADQRFEDQPTFTVINRKFPVPKFRAYIAADYLVVETRKLAFKYHLGSGPFTPENTQVRLRRGTVYVVAHPDFDGPGSTCDEASICHQHSNLGGWFESLDGKKGPVVMHDGILSRDGWYLLNDTASALFRRGQWPVPRPNHQGTYQDGYFFGYGDDYKSGLEDFADLTGHVPLLPRWAFGVWLGVCCSYSAEDYQNRIIPQARLNRVPIDVLTIDTQWKKLSPLINHGQGRSWNGWEWNDQKFPHPQEFLNWASDEGLHIGLNVHPSIYIGDPLYKQVTEIAGTLLPDPDPSAPKESRTWDFGNPKDVKSYFMLHEKFEQQGVRFWWFDGCCGEGISTLKGVAPETWINALYAQRAVDRKLRGFSLSRIGGTDTTDGGDEITPTAAWAEHRYSIHFTGDAFSTWKMLGFEAYFTAEESAIGESYVSHDIGGFRGKRLPDDLYLRWLQLGTFSPIMRLHAGGGGVRLPWEYDATTMASACKFLRLRDQLLPYTYTAARVAHDTGISIVRPLYLNFPNDENAYRFNSEYFFGDQILVAPVATPGDLSKVTMWFPEGKWIDFFTGTQYVGPKVETISMPLDRMPVFVHAGSVIPMLPEGNKASDATSTIVWKIFPGASGASQLYRDAGEGLGYLSGAFSWQTAHYVEQANERVLELSPAGLRFASQKSAQTYEFVFVNAGHYGKITVNGKSLATIPSADARSSGIWHTPASDELHIRLVSVDPLKPVRIVVKEKK